MINLYDSHPSLIQNTKPEYLGLSSIVGIAIVHIGVSVGVIGINTFIPAQLAIIGWETTTIAFIIGITTLFELFRLVIGYLGDNFPLFGSNRRSYVMLGLLIQTLGLFLISQVLGSILILIGMIGFVIGSAIVATMSDAYLLDKTNELSRGQAAGAIQFFRLLGYALGGIFGAIFYGSLKFEGFFISLGFLSILLGVLPALLIKEDKSAKSEVVHPIRETIQLSTHQVMNSQVILMSLFLLFFLIGLFAQDAVLEPFAIKILAFSEGNIGRVAAIWGTTTLIFIPLALVLEKRTSTSYVILLGVCVSSLGLLLVTFIGIGATQGGIPDIISLQNLFLISIGIFGAGAGLVTTPSTTLMLNICSESQSRTFLLAFFGLISTFGRSIASLIAGLIMVYKSFPLLFIVEIGFLLGAFLPYIFLNQLISNNKHSTSLDVITDF